MNLFLYLYSRKNLVGTTLALVGLLLYFVGINSLWYVIIPGLYLIGVTITPQETYGSQRKQVSDQEIRNHLDTVIQSYRKKLPKEAIEKVETIESLIDELLPRLKPLGGSKEAYSVRQMALDYLPTTLQNYVNLPSAFANLHPIKDGKTAKVILLEQLDVLESGMQALTASVLSGDAQKMLANGLFLEDSFKQGESFL
ncbi:hypothetical protein [Deinococcus roseus]|uniref:5-bromo-4-chloroindolyl phosphate hydrolase n=1 Tax=Deinococcus roseus TaxID=392414 RepID=A0ABQ2CYL9_9DEIO|nr:hypothetical protein [Deinococcus roseus]GGJ26534.1 hypothetical protein GCM10008938_10900 [Deinococcus roseus]